MLLLPRQAGGKDGACLVASEGDNVLIGIESVDILRRADLY
jgi:hypothetical protein